MKKTTLPAFTCVLYFFLCSTLLLANDEFAAKEFKGKEGETLLYRIHIPADLPEATQCPLVLVLHGAGHRGNDNKLQISKGYGPLELLNHSKWKKQNAIIIAPQVPAKQQWVDVSWGALEHTMPEKPSATMQLTLELLDKVLKEMPIDKNRVYVTGLSDGGYGTWDIIQRRPELFAAAMPICGGGDLAKAKTIKDIPIWAFHGANDRVVKPIRTSSMINAIYKAGGNPSVSIIPGIRHDAWNKAYGDKHCFSWLFGQKKSQ